MTAAERTALLAAMACFDGALLVGIAAFHLDAGIEVDLTLLEDLRWLWGPLTFHPAGRFISTVDPAPSAVIAGALVLVAIVRREPRLAWATVLVLAGANLTTQALKPLAESVRAPASLPNDIWPSGHATAAMTLALCAVLVAPPLLRPLAAAAASLYATLVVVSITMLTTHYVSDVLAAMFIAGFWTCVGVAGLGALERRRPRGEAQPGAAAGRLRTALAAAGAALAGAAVFVYAALDLAPQWGFGPPWTVLAGVAGLAALAFALCFGIAALAGALPSTGPRRRPRTA